MTAPTGFDTTSYMLKPGYTTTLNKISRVKTTVTVIGHTDSVGSETANQVLSDNARGR